MRPVLIAIGIGIIFLGYHFFQVQRKIKISKQLVSEAIRYEYATENFSKTLLVLGDSTAVGVGSTDPEDSVPALYSKFIEASLVENRAVSGSKISDITVQVKESKEKQYSHILLQVGANDIVAYKSTDVSERELRSLLRTLPAHEQLTVIICGNVGAAKLIPWFLRIFYTRKTLEYHHMYEKVVPEFGGTYVNLYTPRAKDPFVQEPEIYFAEDQFHPSSAGYALWFEKISRAIRK